MLGVKIRIQNPRHRAGSGEVQPLETKIFTASYPITCSVCGRAIGTGSRFTYIPFGQKGALVAAHIECDGNGGLPQSAGRARA